MDFYQMLMAQMAKDAQVADTQPVIGSALADYGSQFLSMLNPPASPSSPMKDYAIKALPFSAGAALPLANDIYGMFKNEDANSNLPLPPTMEAIVREANKGRPTAAANDPMTHTFDLGSLPPEELFRLSLSGGGSGNIMGGYQQLAQQLPQAQRVERKMAPPTDFAAADAAMAAAKPEEFESGGSIGQVLQGMARAGLAGMRGNTADFLLALGLGGLGGLGSGMDLEQEREDLSKERMRQYELTNAGFQSDKAGVQRQEKQQGFDARYESEVTFQAAQAMRQQQMVEMLTHGLDQQNIDNRESRNNAIQIALHNQQMALERWKNSQPTVETNQYGIVTTATDPKTGKRTMTIDNSPWVQKLQTQAMIRQMGALGMMPGGNMPGMDFVDNAEVDAPELVKRLSTYYFMNPMAMQEDLGPEFMTRASSATKNMAGDNDKLVPQMMGNNIYSFLAPIIQDQNHPLHRAVMMRMAQMQGMF